jgi:Anti-sigma-K factor rskA
MRTLRRNPHELAGAYALDALEEGTERERFSRHLRRCGRCAAQVGQMRGVATALAFAAAEDPPPDLRARVLAAAANTRQLPPEVARGSRRWRLPRLAGTTWTPWLGLAYAAAATAVAVVLTVALSSTSGQLAQSRAQGQAIAAVLAAPDAHVLTARVTGGGAATIVESASHRALIVSTTGLRALSAGKVYQLWLIGPTSITSAGLLPAAGPVLASGLVAGDKLGMTVEPAGGTRQPTTTPVLLLPLT